jgi:hypothetical protein
MAASAVQTCTSPSQAAVPSGTARFSNTSMTSRPLARAVWTVLTYISPHHWREVAVDQSAPSHLTRRCSARLDTPSGVLHQAESWSTGQVVMAIPPASHLTCPKTSIGLSTTTTARPMLASVGRAATPTPGGDQPVSEHLLSRVRHPPRLVLPHCAEAAGRLLGGSAVASHPYGGTPIAHLTGPISHHLSSSGALLAMACQARG